MSAKIHVFSFFNTAEYAKKIHEAVHKALTLNNTLQPIHLENDSKTTFFTTSKLNLTTKYYTIDLILSTQNCSDQAESFELCFLEECEICLILSKDELMTIEFLKTFTPPKTSNCTNLLAISGNVSAEYRNKLFDWTLDNRFELFCPFKAIHDKKKKHLGISLLDHVDDDTCTIDTLISSIMCHPWLHSKKFHNIKQLNMLKYKSFSSQINCSDQSEAEMYLSNVLHSSDKIESEEHTDNLQSNSRQNQSQHPIVGDESEYTQNKIEQTNTIVKKSTSLSLNSNSSSILEDTYNDFDISMTQFDAIMQNIQFVRTNALSGNLSASERRDAACKTMEKLISIIGVAEFEI